MGKYFLLLCILLKGFIYLFIYLVCLLHSPWWLQTTMTKFGAALCEVWITCVLIVPMRKKREKKKRLGLTPGTASPVGRALSSLTTASFSNCGGTDLCSSIFFLSLRTEHQLRPPGRRRSVTLKWREPKKWNGPWSRYDRFGPNKSFRFIFVFCF